MYVEGDAIFSRHFSHQDHSHEIQNHKITRYSELHRKRSI